MYFGMIGLCIKCVKFECWFVVCGVDFVWFVEMVCLIGVVGIVDKVLGVIVVVVCVELL